MNRRKMTFVVCLCITHSIYSQRKECTN